VARRGRLAGRIRRGAQRGAQRGHQRAVAVPMTRLRLGARIAGRRGAEALRERIVEAFANGYGKTQAKIAEAEKCSQATVSRILRLAGVEVRRRGWVRK